MHEKVTPRFTDKKTENTLSGAGQSEACQISEYLTFVLKRTLKAWQACIYKGDSGFYVGAKLSFDKIKLSKFCESNQM